MCEPNKYELPKNAFVYAVSSKRRNKPVKVYQTPKLLLDSKRSSPSPKKLREEMKRDTAKAARKNRNGDIVEGMALDDPQVLKMELQDSYNVMSVSRIKLFHYLTILRKHIPGNQVDELHQTLDGIEELCSLLKPKYPFFFTMHDDTPIGKF